MSKEKNRIIAILIIIGDLFIFYFSLYLALFLRKAGSPDMEIFNELREPFLYLFFICSFIFFIIDFYELSSFRKAVSFLRSIFVFFFLAIVSGIVYFYFQPQLELTPRAILFLTVFNFTVFSSLWRYIIFRIVGMKNFRRRLFFVGFCEEMREILSDDFVEYEIIGIYTKGNIPKDVRERVDVFDDIAEVKKIAKDIEGLVFAPNIKDDRETVKMIFSELPLNMKYMEFFTLYEEATKKVPLYSLNEWWFLENISRPKKRMGEIVNRTAEIFFSLCGLLFLLIIFPVVTAVIKIDSRGPVLYRQERTGEKGKKFILYKFRTMRHIPEEEEFPWREEKKGEVTRIGKALRITHFDELPQIYNIIKGDLGFIGPRPEVTKLAKEFEKKIPFYKLRYLVRPGITGWAQINYPASTSLQEAEEKFRYDLYYIKNRSFFLDIIILIKTFRTIF